MFISGEKLLFTGTLAPMKGRSLYGFGMPTPNTLNTQIFKVVKDRDGGKQLRLKRLLSAHLPGM